MNRHRYTPAGLGILCFLFALPATPHPGDPSEKLLASGPEVQVNTFTADDQDEAGVAAHDDGFVVVWTSNGSSGDDSDGESVQARRLDAAGEPFGDEFQVNALTTGNQNSPSVAAWPDGRFVVVWNGHSFSGPNLGLFGRLFTADGTPITDELQVASGTEALNTPDVAISSDGDSFVVVWRNQANPNIAIAGRRYLADGSADGPMFEIGSPVFLENEDQPKIAAAPDGEFLVVWQDEVSDGSDNDGRSVQMRRLDTNGAPTGNHQQVNSYTTGMQNGPAIDVGADGRFVVAWSSYENSPGNDDSYSGVVARRFDAAGSPLGNDFQVNTYTSGYQYTDDVQITPDGGFVVVWSSYAEGTVDTNLWDVTARRFDAAGTPLGDEFVVNTLTFRTQFESRLAMRETGDLLVVWESNETAGTDTDGFSVQARLLLAEADVGVTKTDGVTSATPGGTVTYTIVATNDGPDAATGVELDDPLPKELACTFTSVAEGGATGNTAAGSESLNETLFLPAGASVTYTLDCDIAPQATGNLTNTASILADQVDGNASNDTDFDTDSLEPSADLVLELSADSLDAVPGEETVLLATVSNDGPSTSSGSQIHATLPTGLTFVSSPGCGHQDGDILCLVGNLDPGAEVMGQVTVLVDGELADGIEITVEASLSGDDPDPDADDNTDSVTLVVATPLFHDGFETGNTSGWSTTVP